MRAAAAALWVSECPSLCRLSLYVCMCVCLYIFSISAKANANARPTSTETARSTNGEKAQTDALADSRGAPCVRCRRAEVFGTNDDDDVRACSWKQMIFGVRFCVFCALYVVFFIVFLCWMCLCVCVCWTSFIIFFVFLRQNARSPGVVRGFARRLDGSDKIAHSASKRDCACVSLSLSVFRAEFVSVCVCVCDCVLRVIAISVVVPFFF